MLVFLKLGGSLITDKAQAETPRLDEIRRLAHEVSAALKQRRGLSLVLGHGSGSFGHTVASRYQTRRGVAGEEAWRGFSRVSVIAARLNQIVLEELSEANVPVFKIQPSASAIAYDGVLVTMALDPIKAALAAGLVPLVYGDVCVDTVRGGTIASTEDVLTHCARTMLPKRILLAGDYDGVLDGKDSVIPRITPTLLESLQPAIGQSAHVDVTGGMASKVSSMMALCESIPGLEVRIFSGSQPGLVFQSLVDEDFSSGTVLSA